MVRPARLLPLGEHGAELIFSMVSTGDVDVVGPENAAESPSTSPIPQMTIRAVEQI